MKKTNKLNMIKLNKLNIKFDSYEETPYFQVSTERRIRFGMENLNVNLIKEIIDFVLNKDSNINVIFISEYIVNNKRFSAKSKIGGYIDIKNWKETIGYEEDSNDGMIYATIKNIKKQNVKTYCSKIFNGHTGAYISFYTDEFLLYVSTDVIDIVSDNESKVDKLKEKYIGIYDRYHEEN